MIAASTDLHNSQETSFVYETFSILTFRDPYSYDRILVQWGTVGYWVIPWLPILCPVAECPESSPSSSRHFRGFASIKNHINSHCTGYLSGAVPVEFLRLYNYSQCPVCGNVIHTRYNGTCPRCRPLLRAQYRYEDFC